MNVAIKELRDSTGMTQKEFANRFNIPLSTLRKWEQGESKPPAYVIWMLANMLPDQSGDKLLIVGRSGMKYYYDKYKKTISDSKGNSIHIDEDLDGVKKENLPLYVDDLFDSFYQIQEKFNRDCRYDKQEDIIWS